MIRLTIDRLDAGTQQLDLPYCQYSHVLILNNSAHHLILASERSLAPQSMVGECPPYSTISFPLPPTLQTCYISRGGGAFAGERGHIFFLTEAPGMVGQFRPPPDRPDPTLPGRVLFRGAATVTVLFTATRKIIIDSLLMTNRLATAGTISIAHRRAGVDSFIVEVLSIPGNSMYAIGRMILEAEDDLRVTAFTGTIQLNVYGDGI